MNGSRAWSTLSFESVLDDQDLEGFDLGDGADKFFFNNETYRGYYNKLFAPHLNHHAPFFFESHENEKCGATVCALKLTPPWIYNAETETDRALTPEEFDKVVFRGPITFIGDDNHRFVFEPPVGGCFTAAELLCAIERFSCMDMEKTSRGEHRGIAYQRFCALVRDNAADGYRVVYEERTGLNNIGDQWMPGGAPSHNL